MSRNLSRTALLVVFLLAVFAGVARAQVFPRSAGEDGSISGSGSANVELKPCAIRMYVQLVAKGESVEGALAKLKKRRQAARAKLVELGADKKSVRFDRLALCDAEGNRWNSLQSMIVSRIGSVPTYGGLDPEGSREPKIVSLVETLSAEWAIEFAGVEKLLVDSHALKEKVRTADLADVAGATRTMPVGDPFFVYVGRITDAQSDKAMAEAFVDAKADAARLAKAAGIPLGRLRSLSGNNGVSFGVMGGLFGTFGAGLDKREVHYQQLMDDRGKDDRNEVIGRDPESLSFEFSVNVEFAMEKK